MTSQSAQYRPEIDGLRAIAVLSVMLFHAKIIPFRGGFVGVDIFFVISGFLIMRLIVEAHAQGRWSFVGFWFNRARRLLPPLFIVAMASFAFGWFWLSPSAFKAFGIQLAAGLGFLSNIYFLRSGADYFQLPDDQLPFLHLWSLSVEEQFYLFFPFILFACLRWGVSIRKVLILLCLASFGLSVALTITWPAGNFYLLPTRAWELLAGAIAATIAWPKVTHQASVVLLGLALIIGPILFYTKALAFPGAWALPPVIGTVLVLGYGQSGGWASRLLAARPMVGVGLISYAAYLWHQPLLVFGQSISLAWSNWHAAAAVLLSLLLAGASYALIERPSRGWAAQYPKRFGAACLLIFTLLMGSALAIYRAGGVPSRMPASVQKIEAQKAVMSEQLTRCLFVKDGTPPANGPCLKGNDGPVRIAILGDSHAAALAPAFDQNLSGQGVRAIQLTLPGAFLSLKAKQRKGLGANAEHSCDPRSLPWPKVRRSKPLSFPDAGPHRLNLWRSIMVRAGGKGRLFRSGPTCRRPNPSLHVCKAGSTF